MEPTRNPNVSRSQKQVFYRMTRRYGEQIRIRQVIENDLDYATGTLVRSYREETVRNAVYIPPTNQRNVTYTPAMMQAIRQYAWQGSGQDIDETGFLIAERDIRNWGPFDPTQRVRWRDNTYEVVRDQTFDGGVIVWCKVAVNTHTEDDTVIVGSGIGYWAIGGDFVVS